MKQIIIRKFEEEEGVGLRLRGVRDGYGVGVWKAIKDEWEGIKSKSYFSIRNRKKFKFWKDLWCEDLTLEEAFPNIFSFASYKNGWVLATWE